MKLKTSELKKFQSYAKMIPANTLLPICSYLHFKLGSVTKNSISSFVTMDINCTMELLIDEKILLSVVSQADDEIDVKVKGKQVILNGSIKDSSPTDDAANFPTTPSDADAEWFELPSLALYDIGTCSSLIMDDPQMPARSHVYINKDIIGGGDGVIIYTNKHEGVPNLILNKHSSSILGKFESGSICQSENYQFFHSGDVKFGFVKPEHGLMDFTPFLTIEPDNSFAVDKSVITSFNDHVLSTMTLPNPVASLEAKSGKLYLDVADTAFERTITKQVECDGACDEFTFNVPAMNRLLKSIPDQTLTFTQSPRCLYITGETGFISLIMRVRK